jgi:hypothetical protein
MSTAVKDEPATKDESATQETPDLESLIAKAKRAFALKQYEQASTLYASALEK